MRQIVPEVHMGGENDHCLLIEESNVGIAKSLTRVRSCKYTGQAVSAMERDKGKSSGGAWQSTKG